MDKQRLLELAGIGVIKESTFNVVAGNMEGMIVDMKRLLGQGKIVTLTIEEAHTDERYKGKIFKYTLKQK